MNLRTYKRLLTGNASFNKIKVVTYRPLSFQGGIGEVSLQQ